MPSLRELQHALCAGVVAGGPAVMATVAAFVADDGIAAADRLGIHRNTFTGVAVRALRLNHPAVARLVGDDCFEGAARAYVAKRPPACAWLDGYGVGFAGHLARLPETATLPWLPDVARLEWSVSRVLHAAERPALDVETLAALGAFGPGEEADIRFARRPSVRMLRSEHAADTIWRATLAGDDAALAAIDPASGVRWLLVERTEQTVSVTALSEAEWRFTRDLLGGVPLQRALDRAATLGAFDPAVLLGAHLAAGRLSGCSIAGTAFTPQPIEIA